MSVTDPTAAAVGVRIVDSVVPTRSRRSGRRGGGTCVASAQRQWKGQQLFDAVCEQQNLVERDYFGLSFRDHHNVKVRPPRRQSTAANARSAPVDVSRARHGQWADCPINAAGVAPVQAAPSSASRAGSVPRRDRPSPWTAARVDRDCPPLVIAMVRCGTAPSPTRAYGPSRRRRRSHVAGRAPAHALRPSFQFWLDVEKKIRKQIKNRECFATVRLAGASSPWPHQTAQSHGRRFVRHTPCAPCEGHLPAAVCCAQRRHISTGATQLRRALAPCELQPPPTRRRIRARTLTAALASGVTFARSRRPIFALASRRSARDRYIGRSGLGERWPRRNVDAWLICSGHLSGHFAA